MKPGVLRISGFSLATVAGVLAVVLGTGAIDGDTATVVSDIIYPIVSIGAGLLLIAGAMSRYGRDRVSWILFGAGVTSLGLGELTWVWYELIQGIEPPFPGLPDVFYLAGYPALAVAMLLTPRLGGNRYQRGAQVVDSIVITVGLSVVAWLVALEPMYQEAGETSLAEFVVGAAYPVADVLLVATAVAVGIRKSWRLRDRSLWMVVAALVAMAVGDAVYLAQSWSDSYVSGSWVDATWLVSYGLFALAAAGLTRPVTPRQLGGLSHTLWHILIPATFVYVLVAIHVGRKAVDGEGYTLEAAFSILGLLVLMRILLAVAEYRHLINAERNQLVSAVSHELRTPLTAVQGYLDLALSDWDATTDAERIEMVEIARSEAELVTRIVTDLIATSRDNLHATDLVPEVVDVRSVVVDTTAALGLPRHLSASVDEDLLVVADRKRLAQIVSNLLTNAMRYGGGAVAVEALRSNGHIEIAVHDDGPGVPPRFRDVIWDVFERGSHRFDASTPGSGLGLGIVRSLVRAHGGQTGYRDSVMLGGACFWVRLPATRPAELGTHKSQPPTTVTR